MNRTLTAQEKKEILDEISEFLAEELELPLESVKPDSRIIDDLGGDSMIYLELVEEFKKKYDVNVEIRVIGRYFQKHPIFTVGETAQAVYDIVERGHGLLEGEE